MESDNPVIMQRLWANLNQPDAVTQSGMPITDLTVVGMSQGPNQTPLTRVRVFDGLVAYDDLHPMIAADGAPISATAPGTWGQLYAAGRRS